VVFTVLFAIFIVASFLSPTAAQPPPVVDVVVPRLLNLVTLDGVITGEEWSDAVAMPVTFRFYNASSGTYVANRTGFLYLKHDCNDLWIGVTMDDPVDDSQSWVAVFYDANGDADLPGSGDDEKGMMRPDDVFDVAISGPMTWDNHTDLGGTLDIQGASGWAASWLTFEFVHPLNSGDSLGNDPALTPGDAIFAEFMVGDPEVDPTFYGVAMTAQWAYWFNLITTPCPVGGEILPIHALDLAPYVLMFVMAAITTVILLKRKPT